MLFFCSLFLSVSDSKYLLFPMQAHSGGEFCEKLHTSEYLVPHIKIALHSVNLCNYLLDSNIANSQCFDAFQWEIQLNLALTKAHFPLASSVDFDVGHTAWALIVNATRFLCHRIQ